MKRSLTLSALLIACTPVVALAQGSFQVRFDGNSDYLFERPAWAEVTEGRVHGGVRVLQPSDENQPVIAGMLPMMLNVRHGRSLEVVKTYYFGSQPVSGTNYFLVTETRDRETGQTEFWDIRVFQDLQNRFQLMEARALPMIRRFPPYVPEEPNTPVQPEAKPDYRRPDWVVTKQPPGGIVLRDEHSSEMTAQANKSIGMMNNFGEDVQLASVLHAGTQITEHFKTHLVLRVADGRVFEVTLTEGSFGSHVRWQQL